MKKRKGKGRKKKGKEEQQKGIVKIYFYIFLDIKENEEAKRRAYTSFGKLILAKELNNPIWSLGKSERFCKAQVEFSSPESPGPKYNPTNEEIYKFHKTQKWKIGESVRLPLLAGEKFAYYNYKYNINNDLSRIPKKWNSILGGSIGLESRINYDFREKSPGPGRYNPDIQVIKPNSYHCVLGGKLGSIASTIMTGTNEQVGPLTYRVENAKNTSNHKNFPAWSIGKQSRQGILNKTWTKNETFENYSSLGTQIRTHKISEPKIHIGKSTREIEKHRGYFPSSMARIHSKVYIPLPKFNQFKQF